MKWGTYKAYLLWFWLGWLFKIPYYTLYQKTNTWRKIKVIFTFIKKHNDWKLIIKYIFTGLTDKVQITEKKWKVPPLILLDLIFPPSAHLWRHYPILSISKPSIYILGEIRIENWKCLKYGRFWQVKELQKYELNWKSHKKIF